MAVVSAYRRIYPNYSRHLTTFTDIHKYTIIIEIAKNKVNNKF